MANPTAHTRCVDYSDFQSANPGTVLAGRSTGGTPTTHQIRAAGIGGGLSAADAAAYTTALEAYLDDIGAGVIA